MKRIVPTIMLVASLVTCVCAQPAFINYQGRLLDAAGQPLANDTYTLEFNIYDSANDGAKVWGPFLYDDGGAIGHGPKAVVANGRFNVILGTHDTANRPLTNAFTAENRFVEIKVNGGDPILPRQQFLSAPYALEATSAQLLNHVPPVQYLNPPGIVVPFAGPADKVPAGWLLCDGTAYDRNSYPALFSAISTNWGEDAAHVGQYFRVPDLRSMFLRGVNGDRTGSYADPDAGSRAAGGLGTTGNTGNNVGSVQAQRIPIHNHRWGQTTSGDVFSSKLQTWLTPSAASPVDVLYPFVASKAGDSHDDDSFGVKNNPSSLYTDPASTEARSGETRPNNAYVNYIIKY
jgi:microcystin-dependent protein